MALVTALANRSDEELEDLLAARPDVLAPSVPRSFSALATRLSAWSSVMRCLDGLDRFSHQLLVGFCLLDGPTSAEGLADVLGAKAAGVTVGEVRTGLERLVVHGLVWVDGEGAHLLDPLRTTLARTAGLGPPLAQLLAGLRREVVDVMARNVGVAAPKGNKPKKAELVTRLAEVLGDPARVGELLAAAPAQARALLDRLTGGADTLGYGSAYWHGQQPRTPLEWLQSRGMAVAVSWNQVEVPREVGLALRGGRPFPDLRPRPPDLVTTDVVATGAGQHEPDAAAAAADLLAGIEELCAEWSRSPAAVLKAGGLGAREVKRAARAVDRDPAELPLLAELSLAPALVTVHGAAILPTTAFDDWLALEPADRWLAVVRGWLASHRWPSLAGQLDANDKPIPALHPANRARQARDQRSDVLAALATLPERTGATIKSVAERVVWLAPGRWDVGPAEPVELVSWVLEEASALGVTSGGALTAPALALLGGDESGARTAARAWLPSPTTSLTLQADLTALAAGTLHPTLAAELHLAADVESKGAATVFRFSEATIRRALDAGRSAEELLDFLRHHATKGVPQPLAYLISDVGRRHGALRAGGVTSYLRSDDPALLARALRSKRAAALGLRQLAPTVVVADAPVAQVLAVLRADGLLPAEEGPDGALVSAQPTPRRAAVPPVPPDVVKAPDVAAAEITQVVQALRAAPPAFSTEASSPARAPSEMLSFLDGDFPDPEEADFGTGGGDGFADEPEAVIDLLLDALDAGCPVLVGHEDPESGYEEEVFELVNMAEDVLYTRTPTGGALRAIKLRRIEWAQLVGEQALSVRP